jgi:glycerol kinase
MKLILALDQSTSATKAVLFNAAGRVVDRAVREHHQIHPQAGWVEHDANEIWINTREVIREIVRRERAPLARLAGISVTNQRETVVVFDRRTGKPLSPAIVWQCRRSEAICQRLREQGHEQLVRRRTGLRIDTYFSGSKIAWLLQERPGLAARLADGSAVVGTIDAYLLHRLTTGAVFATDHTNASRTLLYDVTKLRWDKKLCALFGVPREALPEVRESAAHFGVTTAGGVLPREVPIVGVMGDSQAALFAHEGHAPGASKATFGTGTSVLLNIGEKFRPPAHGMVTALAWVRDGVPTYACEGLISFSAATVAWLKDNLGLIGDAAEAETLARAVPDSAGVYLVPAFAGLGAPHWSADARAAILGLTTFTRREHVVRAALESIAYQVRDVLDVMGAASGVAPQVMHADGGPTRNRLLMQFTADLTGVELQVSRLAEASAWGAAMNGFQALGLRTRPPSGTRVFRPEMPPAQVRRLHAGWATAVRRLL